MRGAAGLLLLLALAGCRTGAVGPAAPIGPARALAAIVDAGPFGGAQWGVLAVDLTTGDTLLARAPATRFIPASTMKIATTVAALELLGADYRWRTELWAAGAVDAASATLAGDLVVPGTGDPSLSERFWTEPPPPLDLLASAAPENGIRRVTGALVIDASRWDSSTVRASWMVDDLPFDYGATGGAFTLAEGETRVEVRGGGAPNDPAAVEWWPKGEDGFVVSRVRTVADGATAVSASYLPESRVLELTGTVAVGRVDTLAFATRDPVRQSAAALHRALAAQGVVVEGGWRIEWDAGVSFGPDCVTGATPPCAGARLLRGLGSPPLIDIVAGVLGPSQNWIAEQLVRSLAPAGARARWNEGTAAAARALEERVGVVPLDVRMMDGSGLSVQDLVTPRALVQMLRHARAQPWGAAFHAALPQPGDEGSTLESRLTDLGDRLSAKTGTLTNVSTLAGYLVDERGREIAFAVMVNASNLPGATVREGIDAVVRLLAARR